MGALYSGLACSPPHHLTPTLDGLFRKMIAAADAQAHVEPTQIQGGRVEVDIAEPRLIGGDNLE